MGSPADGALMKARPLTYDDFGDGIDRRSGIISNSTKKFWELENYVVTSGRKIETRAPLLAYAGGIDNVNSQGAKYLNGEIVTVGKLGVPATHTVDNVTTVYFDNPEGATTWELLELVMYQEQVCALIQHAFPGSTAAPLRNFLHVFDDRRPTYTEDPACPPSWAPSYPLQPFGESKPGAYRSYRPRLSIVAERLAMTTASGDVALCAVGLPRVWNTLSPAEILANGEMFYRILGIQTGATWSFTLPVTFEDLRLDARYAAYVCEYLLADGTWEQLTEVTSAGNAGEYSIASVTNRFDSSQKNETRITINPPSGAYDGMLIRFRAIADPPVVIVNGLNLTARTVAGELQVEGGNLVGGVMVHEGKSYNIQTVSIPKLTTPGENVRVVVRVPSAQISTPIIIAADTVDCPLNGQQRYWSRIVADITANDGVQEREGTVGIIAGDSTNDGTLSPDGSGPWPYTYLYSSAPGWDTAHFAPNIAGLSIGDILQVGPVKCEVIGFAPASYSIYMYWGARGRARIESNCPRVRILSGQEGLWIYGNGSGQPRYEWAEVGFNGGYTYAITGRTTITVGGTRLDGAGTRYTTDLKVGKNVEVNGEVRKVISITSDIVAEVELPFTTAGSYIALRDPRYEYAYDVGETGNEWYATKEAEITLRESGKDDAVVLGTSSYDDSGGQPLSIAAMQNRMLVQYPTQLQMWAVGASLASFRHVSTMGQGSGLSTRPEPVLVDGMIGIPTGNGPRLFSPDGDDKSYITFIAVGDMLKGFDFPDMQRAVWWPRLRAWIMYVGDSTFYVLSVHRDVKVLAWSTWVIPDAVATVDGLFVIGERLALLSGATLYYFDADVASRVEFDGNAVETRARWIYNNMGSPTRNKKIIAVDIAQTGKSTISVHVNPRNMDIAAVSGPTVSGVTFGMQRVPVMAMGLGIGLDVSSSDPNGHSLDQLVVDYTLLNR